MSDDIIEITADEAVDAITEADFVTDEGRHVIHTFKGTLGADWDTMNAIEVVRNDATRIAWANHWLYGWCLCVETVPGAGVIVFDTVRPQPKSEKEARES